MTATMSQARAMSVIPFPKATTSDTAIKNCSLPLTQLTPSRPRSFLLVCYCAGKWGARFFTSANFPYMETTSIIKNGAVQLPPGFRFHPTDEELVVQYLKRKVMSSPLPAAVIPEINLRKLDPWDLPGENKGARYLFNLRETTYQNRSLSGWATPTGYWKTAGKIKPVVASGSNELVGMKKLLVFHRGKPPHGSPTDWIMHEYHCLHSIGALSSAHGNSLIHRCATHCKDWVVCRIFKKRARNYTVGRVQLNTCSSSSSSSCVTDIDVEEGDGSSSSSSSINPPVHGRVP